MPQKSEGSFSNINSSKLKCGQKELDYLFEIDSYIEGKDDIGAQIRKLVLFKEKPKEDNIESKFSQGCCL